MLISRNWLADYVDFAELDAEEFSELITTRVAEVDHTYRIGSPVDAAIVVFIKAATPHPEKPKLTICTLETGSEEVCVVCGAPNVKAGSFAVYLAPGNWVYRPGSRVGEDEQRQVIESREVANVQSFGVLVSEAELGLSALHEGILLLNDDVLREARPGAAKIHKLAAGEKLSTYFPGEDVLLEIDNKSLTHRPDLWSHFGFAREIAAILGRPLKKNVDLWADDEARGRELFAALGAGVSPANEFSVEIEPGCGCRRFTALEFRNVRSVPSPLWMRRRLFSIGAGVRSFLIDLSNYVMHDVGQPNHAYDADRLSGRTVYVRLAREGETFLGLDEEERTLTAEDIVIADDSGAVALGGVIGGARDSVSESTTRLLLESANFDPVRVRKTSKRQQVRTDASNRFEKSLSAYSPAVGTQRFTELLLEVLPDAQVVGPPSDCFPERPKEIYVPYRPAYIRERLGSENSDSQIDKILTSLGFTQKQDSETGSALLKVPYYRATRDISIEEDLVEEVGRIFGYENVPECAPKIDSSARAPRPIPELEYRLQDALRGMGFAETYNYSFNNPKRAEALGYWVANAIRLQNPIDSNCDAVRTTLVSGMLDHLEKNRRQVSALSLFECGRAYESAPIPGRDALGCVRVDRTPAAYERRLLCLGYSSGRKEEEVSELCSPRVSAGADFYALLSVIERLVCLAGVGTLRAVPLKAEAGSSEAWDYSKCKIWMHPHRAAALSLSGEIFGVIAEVSPEMLSGFPSRAVVAELDLELMYAAERSLLHFKPLPKYPDSFFEMSVVMPKRRYYEELERLLRANVDSSLLRQIEVVSVYEGKPLDEGQKSVSVKLYLGADDRTLSGEELGRIQDGLVSAVAASEFELRT